MMVPGRVEDWPRRLLRIEAAALFLAALVGYSWTSQSWWLFAILFLAPDLGMAGYLAGPRPGAAIYNLVHTTTLPLLLSLSAFALGDRLPAALGMIWLAHIGFDRALGFGLKYPGGFSLTHLGAKAGRAEAGTGQGA
ncbi:DUF4260 domain-containing protein [Aurantimonas sp. MSK8Z-1]|uniref:DUF4260 domain-containing protein n=1 Tax=Mangrovibrevibacter kandeliae TaxID=2968473 RepID=UPI0021177EF1|nr:DUF4260 domain-containing protein [Aurantimonas sp. MSK8Z-1]MCW4117093.1 DUF4260 domain-containing protein [Aurantimonas sp. MSK8Z-1]